MQMANNRSPAPDRLDSAVLPPWDGVRPPARRLLETSVVAFAERGYHGVSVRDITAAVGIKAGSFYSHFTSKERLLFELMLLGHQTHQAFVRDALLSADPDPAHQLREAIRANVWFQGTYPLLTVVANTELHALSADNRERILNIRHESGVLVAAVIDRGNDMGVFDCARPWLAMAAIASMGVRLAWWFRQDDPTDATPLDMYPAEAQKWLPGDTLILDEIAADYAEYALKIVSYRTGK
jgi:AcrR family transcriptional regulator